MTVADSLPPLITSYHRPSGYFALCNAGHPRPLIYSVRTRQWTLLDYTIENTVDDIFNHLDVDLTAIAARFTETWPRKFCILRIRILRA